MKEFRIGIIGLDTSHAIAFTKLLNNPSEYWHVKGGKVTHAFPSGSSGFPLSASRVGKFTEDIQESYDVEIVDSIEVIAKISDAILLESVDGGQHLEQLKQIITYQKPVFIDKPFALNTKDADDMIALSKEYNTPIMSTSALRFAEGLQFVLTHTDKRKIIGADCFGPMDILPEQPGFYWYGIHAIEMLFTILGEGSDSVITETTKDHDQITAKWKDGRIGTVRGNRAGNSSFGALIHFEDGTEYVDVSLDKKPFYASLLEHIIDFFEKKEAKVPLSETREVIRFIEAANESRESGEKVSL